MRIALDGRMLYRDRAGIGRYVWELQRAIGSFDDDLARSITLLLDPRDRAHRRAAVRTRAVAMPARHARERQLLGWSLRRYQAAHFPDHALPPGVRLPSVVTVHDVSFLTYPLAYDAPSRDFYGAALHDLDRAAHVVTVSAHVRNQLLERRLVPSSRVTVIPEAPTTVLDVEDPTSPVAGPYALMVGTLQPRKNHVRAASAWLRTRVASAIPLLVVGALGYQGENIVRQVRALDSEARVRFAGRLSDAMLARLYAHASLLLQPSLDEGFGLPVLEAMRAGVPCIVSNIDALREVAGDAAVFVDPLDPEVIAQAVDSLVSDAAALEHLRDAGRARAAQFSWTRAAKETLAVYEQIL